MTLTALSIHLPAETTDRSYPILIGPKLLQDVTLISKHVSARNVLIVTNTTIAPLYLMTLKQALMGKRIAEISLPDGEHTKSFATLNLIFDALIENRMNRDAAIIALGGGVVGDMAGFAAACYQRGIDYIQIPTTLLAQVDSSVGGKTAVNHPGGKNLIGAFHQPRAVIADISVLNTLSDREMRAGFAEVIKYGLIYDVEFFSWLEQNASKILSRDAAALTHAIKRSCEIKAEVVSQDEREQGLRAILNLGHTFGHAIENALGYGEWLHGEAVAAGMVLASEMSHRLGWISAQDHQRAIDLIESSGLPIKAPSIGATKALELMGMDKKVLSGQLRLVLLKKIGQAVITSDYPAEILQATLKHGFEAA
ncbi:MAG TPA: 3-dehydroquinate synthase [Steroidobacteraceae bacterium]|nr:3-dehydroquinate synthase [Steroidobacteraceae bacterium]